MSYCIVSVIYGIPLTEDMENENNRRCEEYEAQDPGGDEWPEGLSEEFEVYGFEVEYSGHAMSTVGYCGVELGGFDECCNFLHLDEVGPFEPTDEQRAQAEEKINALPDWLRELAPEIGTYFIFSTS